MSILIKAALVENKRKDIYIEDSRIVEVAESITTEADHKISGKSKAAIPSFVNGHTHAAMTLLRGYADDMELMPWLEEEIWPTEAKMRKEDIYWGSKLACLEMIKSGTTFFNDMYWEPEQTIRAAEESGIRSLIGLLMIDFDKRGSPGEIKKRLSGISHNKHLTRLSIDPHAIYTVSKENLAWAGDFAAKNSLPMHIHLSETRDEVEDCINKHKMRPVEYLESIGFLEQRVIAAHAVWLNETELDICKKRGVRLIHNPVSNMKLSVGNVINYKGITARKIPLALGTDGCSSNNSLDMFDDMKIAALLQKHHNTDSTVLPANEIFDIATVSGAKVFSLNSGEIKEGNDADLLLINLKNNLLVPHHNIISNIVYSANSECVDTTICNGRILMQGRKVEGEEEIIEKFNEHAASLAR
ncbi:amidohydrolase [Candidatus Woesearchaeota archaeon]|nr:amidohydrolase [Candidatus Woesearchaeota archaeon]